MHKLNCTHTDAATHNHNIVFNAAIAEHVMMRTSTNLITYFHQYYFFSMLLLLLLSGDGFSVFVDLLIQVNHNQVTVRLEIIALNFLVVVFLLLRYK